METNPHINEEPDYFCHKCGYALTTLTVNRCPECGHFFNVSQLRLRRRYAYAAVAFAIFLLMLIACQALSVVIQKLGWPHRSTRFVGDWWNRSHAPWYIAFTVWLPAMLSAIGAIFIAVGLKRRLRRDFIGTSDLLFAGFVAAVGVVLMYSWCFNWVMRD